MHKSEQDLNYAIFETDLGTFALVWGDGGVRELWLPQDSRAELLKLAVRTGARPGTPAGKIARFVAQVRDYAAGKKVDFAGAPLDLSCVTPFARSVYEATCRIGRGATATYGEIALGIGKPGASRAVGQALGRNPLPVVVPCHRVVASRGLGGFSAPFHLKVRLLELEGVGAGRLARELRQPSRQATTKLLTADH